MPINIDTYENLAGEILKVYEEAERTMMRRVKNRLARGIDQPGWTERKYGEMRDVRNEMAKYVAGLSATRGAMQRQFLEKAYGDARAAMISDARTFGELSQIQGLTPNTMKVVNIMTELDSLMDAADRRILRSVNDAYADIVGRTSALVATGSITYREAVQRELNDFADRGITSFVDRAGKSWDMETYAEMATLTAIERATREGYTDAMMEFGYDLAQISDHYGACPICEAWQGVVISITGNTPGYETLADAEAAGVFHPRCMHDYSVYYEGISPEGRMAPADVGGPSDGYAVRAQQRSLERHIREWKRRMAVAATPEEERAAYARVRMYQQRLRDLIDEYNDLTDPSIDHLPRKYWREGGRTKLSSAAKKLKPVEIPQPKPKEPTRIVVNGRDITATWTRRADRFKFEIQDIINAQGFDGKPRIVSAEEFDRLVKEANGGNGFVAQRSYSAPSQEVLDAYRQQLYYGEWYVDCSTGGAQYGKGMYCAADYNGVLSDGIKAEMEHYTSLGQSRYAEIQSKYAEQVYQREIQSVKLPFPEKYRNAFTDYSGITSLWTKRDSEEYKYVQRWASDNPSAAKQIIEQLRLAQKRGAEKGMAIEQMSRAEFGKAYPNLVPRSYVETMTLDRSARIITFSDLREEKRRAGYDRMDDGVYAAMRGYDAINASGHGESGSYTVILNRTKLIIRRP